MFSRQRIISFSSNTSSYEQRSEEDMLYEELKLLSKQLRENDVLYYKPGFIPKLTDAEYDALAVREADICQKYPHLLQRIQNETGLGKDATRYGGRVGLILPGKDKLMHLENSPMQSLENAMTDTHVTKWLNRIRKIILKNFEFQDISTFEIIAEPKLDGLSLSLRYELISKKDRKYSLKWAATRGDGTKGEDVSEAILSMKEVPRMIVMDGSVDEIPETIEVRGEIVLPRSTFLELKNSSVKHNEANSPNDSETDSHGKTSFSNARNAASGILMRRKSKDEQTKDEIERTKHLRSLLRFHAYACAFADKDGKDEFHIYEDGIQLRSFLSNLGFLIPEPFKVFKMMLRKENEFEEKDCVDLFQFHEQIMNIRNSTIPMLLDFEVDGAVYKVSSSKFRGVLGKNLSFI
jgi:NAD-dependent DNA ligase